MAASSVAQGGKLPKHMAWFAPCCSQPSSSMAVRSSRCAKHIAHLRQGPSVQLQVQHSKLYPAAVYLIIWRQSSFDLVQALNCS